MSDGAQHALIDAAAVRFRGAGQFAYYYARSKLNHDPVYFTLLRNGLIADHARVLDLGCGQGILLALLAAIENLPDQWPQDWAAAPTGLELHGIDNQPRAAGRARAALGLQAGIVVADLIDAAFPQSDVVILLDVLHYIDRTAQETVLAKAAGALARHGRLIIRVADSDVRVKALVTGVADRFGALLRGELWGRYHLRPLKEWHAMLSGLGLAVERISMTEYSTLANTLLVGYRP